MTASKNKLSSFFAGAILALMSAAVAHLIIVQMDVEYVFVLPLYFIFFAAVYGPIGTVLLLVAALCLSMKRHVPLSHFFAGKF